MISGVKTALLLHLLGLKLFYGKKTTLKDEIAKRQHQNYVQNEEKATKVGQPWGEEDELHRHTQAHRHTHTHTHAVFYLLFRTRPVRLRC